MRSFMCVVCVLAACGSSQKPASQRIEYDPELAEACIPEWGGEAPASLCDKGEDGQWTLPEGDPGRSQISQILALEENHRGKSVDEAIVQLSTMVVDRSGGMTCGAQMGRWHRALAEVRLGLWKVAFQDFASVIKDGPNNPYSGFVDEWMTLIEPHLPAGAVASCMVSYDSAALETKTAPTE